MLAKKAVEDISANFTWTNTAGKIYKRLLEIDSDLKSRGR